MNCADVLEKARAYSRVTSSGEADSQVNDLIQESLYAFAADVGGFFTEDYLPLTPKFDIETHFAIRLTVNGGSNDLVATDVAIASSAGLDRLGGPVASNLQTAIVAKGASDVVVAWDSSNLNFTITDSNATAITVAEPSSGLYADATELLFGKTGAQDDTWEGGFPQNCTIEVTLPTDLQSLISVDWDGHPLVEAPYVQSMSPGGPGTPWRYAVIDGTRLRIWPSPTEQKMLHVWYNKFPAVIITSGVINTNLPSDIPVNYHNALAYWVAAEMCAKNFDEKSEAKYYGKYWRMKNKYLVQKLSHNTVVVPKPKGYLDYRVIV